MSTGRAGRVRRTTRIAVTCTALLLLAPAPATAASPIDLTSGFCVNPNSSPATLGYANSVNSSLGYAAGFVVDTSRNANGSNGQWCNPAGRGLGTPAQVGGGAELLLWIKTPGNSDGACGIAPTTPAGQFDPAIAVRLIDGT
ncbi:MAG: glycoside hydrolase family 6 protein [Kibdelosporangium sp.]